MWYKAWFSKIPWFLSLLKGNLPSSKDKKQSFFAESNFIKDPLCALWIIFKNNKMELLQSQAPAKRKLLGSSVVRTCEFGNRTFDLRIWSLDIGVWTWEPLLNLFRTSLEPLLSIFLASFDSYDFLSTWLTLSSCSDSVVTVLQ